MNSRTVDWPDFFTSSIERIHEQLSIVVNAWGCREGWLQGELFLAGREFDLRVNQYRLAPRQTADLWSKGAPEMIAEIKIIGADYYAKMRYAIESDVQRMRDATDQSMERYMILIVPRSDIRTSLGDYLHTCSFSPICIERNFPGFRLRIWRF